MIEQSDDTGWCAWCERGTAQRQPANIDRVKTVDVPGRIHSLDDHRFVNGRRQR
jgi:hypothetical protein